MGIGTTLALLQHTCMYPSRIDELKMQQTGLEIRHARSRRIQFGMLSGPGALEMSVWRSSLSTSSMDMMYCAAVGRL